MNHLSIPPEKLYLRFQVMPVTTYKFTCFSVVQNNVNLVPIYDYLCSTPIIRLQNIWNWIVKHWNRIHDMISCEKSFQNSQYSQYRYKYIHNEINHTQLNDYLQQFVNNDPFKAIFGIQCLLHYVFP